MVPSSKRETRRGVSDERILITGNEAAGEAAIRAGCRHYFGYPITPQNELTAYMAAHMPKAGGTFIQAESELAAINMCFGCAAAGRRVMTSSSSPGISLKQEGISYLAGAELPAVVINVMRGGPGLGNIEPSQGDYFQATKGGGHGDYHIIVLAPSTVEEFANLTMLAFDLADAYRIPVMILADGRLGQMMEPCRFRPPPPRELPAKDWALTGARGRPGRRIVSLWLAHGAVHAHCLARLERYRVIARDEVRVEATGVHEADVVCVAYGSMARICLEARRRATEQGLNLGLIRPVTLWPFPTPTVQALAEQGKKLLVAEMSAGQMVEDVRLAVEGRTPVGFIGRPGGESPSADAVIAAAKKMCEG
jgi:2-oxoglutarate ferredoxin oxidoreductase subunit alpha